MKIQYCDYGNKCIIDTLVCLHSHNTGFSFITTILSFLFEKRKITEWFIDENFRRVQLSF